MAKSYKVKKGGSKKRYGGSRNFKGGSVSGGCGSCLLKGGSTRKKRGGDFNKSILAYTGKPQPPSAPSPFLAYTKKGGNRPNLASAYPNPGKNPSFMNWMNSSQTQNGGGGGYPYPNGLTGNPWTPSAQTWPGVNGIDSDNNHFELNNYNNDISRQMVDVGPAAPYAIGGSRRRGRKGKRGNKIQRGRSRKGGIVFGPNSLLQDAANVGRQISSGLGGIYNGLKGYPGPVNPMPWKGQLVNSNSSNLNYLKYTK